MILASHNTMTYLPPKKWWMKIFKPIYQCQDKDIKQQLDKGVRYFDIRIAFDKWGNPEFRHGLVAFKGNVYDIMDLLPDGVVCRIVLERVTDELDYTLFINFCKHIKNKYPNIIFTCGEYKKTKEVIYDFGQYVPVVEMYGSVRGEGLERIFPKLYAKRHHWELFSDDYLMIDFV